MQLKPIIKWVGGKTQSLSVLREYLFINDTYTYIEPFIGGGSVLLSCKPKSFILGDNNPNLVCLYKTVWKNTVPLISKLEQLEKEYNSSDAKQELYLSYRTTYNKIKYTSLTNENKNILCDENVEIASLFIILNKLGFNGVYRENSQGEFNVPFGKVMKLTIDYDNMKNVANYFSMSNVEMYCMSYQDIVNMAVKRRLKKVVLYLDPPYFVCEESKFTKYSCISDFTSNNKQAHIELYENIKKWHNARSHWHILCSNAYDSIIYELSNKCNLGTRIFNTSKQISRSSATEMISYTKDSIFWKQYIDYLTGKSKFDTVEQEKKFLAHLVTDKENFNVGKLGELAVHRLFAEYGIVINKCPYKENVRPDGYIEIGDKKYLVEIKSRTYTCTGTASEKIDCIPRKLNVFFKKYNCHSIVIFVAGQITEKSGQMFLYGNSDYVTQFKEFAKSTSGVDYWLSFGELEDWIRNQRAMT